MILSNKTSEELKYKIGLLRQQIDFYKKQESDAANLKRVRPASLKVGHVIRAQHDEVNNINRVARLEILDIETCLLEYNRQKRRYYAVHTKMLNCKKSQEQESYFYLRAKDKILIEK